ncbi:MAG TPA: XdhC/CoxI family protein [Bradyrhizobium sp.]|jgi:xanthine dehydrogenase accessory factor|nr:XdhC/CoxI family protein [Bradyrhizobium sp.]
MTRVELRKADRRDPVAAARHWLDEHGRAALATVVSTWGSAPVPVGGQLAVAPGERFEGSVSGGCVETDVIAEAADVMAGGGPKLLAFGVADETAWRAGLPCGGTVRVLVEGLERGRDAGFLDAILAARAERRSLAVVTNVATGARSVLEEGASLPPEAASCVASGKSLLIETPEGGEFVHAIVPPIRVVIAGATHIGQVLAGLAETIGYEVVVVDPRAAFATEERFAGTPTVAAWPEMSLPALGLDARTAVVALTHAAHIDDEALATALRSPCLYIGALGSKRTKEKRAERLKQAGFSDQDLARIHAPVGLPIGAQGPAEIAVAILAEIIKVARGGA